MKLLRLKSRVVESVAAGTTIGIMECISTWAIHSLGETTLRDAILIATPIAVAIAVTFRALLKNMKNRTPHFESLTRPGKTKQQQKAQSTFMSEDYMADLWAKFCVNERPGDYLRFIEGESDEDPAIGEKRG